MSDCRIIEGDCVEVMARMESGIYDAVITDPPYPHIKRSYGTWTEAEWWEMMRQVVPQCMRLLKPSGSAVFILQPNSERVGRMRTWLWEFMLWVGKEWGIVQDAYAWNVKAIPEAHSIQGRLMRPSLKYAVWVGPPDCWRDQDAVLWDESLSNLAHRTTARARTGDVRRDSVSGHGQALLRATVAAESRGGVLPFNVLPVHHGRGQSSAGAHGHGAGTPLALARWWVRYICPPSGLVLDPFAGSGTVPLAALAEGRQAVGIERIPEYVAIARRRIAETIPPLFVEAAS